MKNLNLILVFCIIQICVVSSLPLLFGYNFEPQEVRITDATTKEEAVSALRVAVENEYRYRAAISKLYKGMLIEVILLLLLTFYAKQKLQNAKGASRV